MDAAPKPKMPAWLSWGAVALVATLAGLLLPQMMPGEPAPRPKVEAKDKSSWDYTAPTLPDVPNPQAMFARLAVGTLFVLGLAVVSLWLMRRWLVMPGVGGPRAGQLQLKETLQLGNRCVLHLVHLGKQPVLIGTDGTGIKTIVPLATSFDEMLASAQEEPPPLKVAA